MADNFLGEIRVFGFGIVPKGWTTCSGQLLNINTNQALYSLLGTYFGGNGTTTFALPDLRGRLSVGSGTGFTVGAAGGEENHTLLTSEMPTHVHAMTGSSANASPGVVATNAYPAVASKAVYAQSSDTTLGAGSASNGSGQGHPNLPPYQAVNFCIALVGIYPTRS